MEKVRLFLKDDLKERNTRGGFLNYMRDSADEDRTERKDGTKKVFPVKFCRSAEEMTLCIR